MDVVRMLDELEREAFRNPQIRRQLLQTKQETNPLSAFCKKCRELGYELYEMDIISTGEEFHDAMKRSTNGGGENSPMLPGEDDFYDLFMASIEEYGQ